MDNLINEQQMLDMLRKSKKTLLVEPKYPRKYPPLGLAKIKTFLEQNKNNKSMYSRTIIPDKFDLICVTSLFTYYSQHVFDVLNNRGLFNIDTPILVGGVFASMMPEQFKDKRNVYVFKGYSKVLDQCTPNKDLMNTVEDPWDTFSYVFTSRGCPNKCLAGNTIINTIEGNFPIKDLVGKEIGVYTYSQNEERVFISKAIHIREMGVKELVRVAFDDGTHIDCTPDQRFLTFKKGNNQFIKFPDEEKEAQDLRIGDSIRAFKLYKSKSGYVDVGWKRGKDGHQHQHRMVMEYVLGRKLKKGEIVHHKKEKWNNIPKNLKLHSSIKEHYKDHPEISERMRKNNPSTSHTEETKEKLRIAITGKKRSLETRKKLSNSKLGEKNPNYKDGKTTGRSRINDGENHKIVSVIPVEKPQMTYDMEVPETGWFFANNVLVHNCPYCVVWRIEKERWVNDKWKDHIIMDRPNIMISDNNLSAVTFDHLKEIIDFAVKNNKRLLFDNGFDCKYITIPMAKELARVKYARSGMRLAFDRIEEDGIFQKAVNTLIDNGVPSSAIMAYILFNFTDRPKDADYRARECTKLKIRPYPQYYRPLHTLKKSKIFIGKHWTKNMGQAFRHFWLMRGLNSKMEFDTYIKSKDAKENHKINNIDIALWDSNGM